MHRVFLTAAAVFLTAAAVSLTALAATAAVTIPAHASTTVPTTVTGSESVDKFGTVHFQGCLQSADHSLDDGANGLGTAVRVQYATSASGPWANLTTSVQYSGNKPGCDLGLAGTARIHSTWSYYRIDFTGKDGYQASASKPVLAWKYDDRIANFKAQRHGNTVAVSGELEYYYNGWHPYAGQRITVVFEPRGGNSWYWHVKPTTNKSGRFTGSMTYKQAAHWSAGYSGNPTHFVTGAPQTWIGG
jgi:hypothetical protein